MSQSIPTGYISSGQPPGKFFGTSESWPRDTVSCLISCPGAKMMVEFSGVGQTFPKLE